MGGWCGRAPLVLLSLALCLVACGAPTAGPPQLNPPGFAMGGLRAEAPPVVESFEPSGDGVVIGTAITVRFSRPMQHESVEEGLRFRPEAPGAVEWLDSRTLRVQPAALSYGTGYQVTLQGSSLAGRPLTGTRGWAFTTAQAPPPPIVARPFTLTFDDCGSEESIRGLMSALDYRGLKAIFFPTGLCRDQFPWLVPSLLAAGHTVCNHTYSHPQLTKLSSAQIAYQIANGVHAGCNLFRPPYGAWDGPRGRIAAIAASQGYRVQLWDVDTRDWAGTSPDSMVRQVRARGGMVLMHMHANLHTAEAIRAL